MSQTVQSQIQDSNRTGYPLFTAAEVAQWPQVSWLIEGVIQKQSAVMLYGESRIGKSFLALDLAAKLASGEPWFGYKVTPCRVIFFAAESPAGLRVRLRAIHHYAGSEETGQLLFMHSPVDLGNSEDVERLLRTVDGTADVLIIDTLNAASGDLDENSSSEMARVLGAMRRLISQTGCTVVIVHHCGWSTQDHPRGHSSLPAAADTRIQVKQMSGYPSWRVKGQREGADTEFRRFDLRVVDLPDGEGTSCVVVPLDPEPAAKVQARPAITLNQKTVLSVAEKLAANAQPFAEEALVTESTSGIEGSPRHAKQRAGEAIHSLIQKGLLSRDQSGLLSIKV